MFLKNLFILSLLCSFTIVNAQILPDAPEEVTISPNVGSFTNDLTNDIGTLIIPSAINIDGWTPEGNESETSLETEESSNPTNSNQPTGTGGGTLSKWATGIGGTDIGGTDIGGTDIGGTDISGVDGKTDNSGTEEEEEESCFTPILGVGPVVTGTCPCDFHFDIHITKPQDCQCITVITKQEMKVINGSAPNLNSEHGGGTSISNCQFGASYFYEVTLQYAGDCGYGTLFAIGLVDPVGSSDDPLCQPGDIFVDQGVCPCDVDFEINLPDGAEIANLAISDLNNLTSPLIDIYVDGAIPHDFCDNTGDGLNIICTDEIDTSFNLADLLGDVCNGDLGGIQIEYILVGGDGTPTIFIYELPAPPSEPLPDGVECNTATGGKTNQNAQSKSLNPQIENITIAPNPTNDLVYLSLPDNVIDKLLNINITDLSGRVVQVFNNIAVNNSVKINTTDYNLSSGIYLLNVQYEDKSHTQKLMISK